MAITGYDRQFYNNVSRIADALERANDLKELEIERSHHPSRPDRLFELQRRIDAQTPTR